MRKRRRLPISRGFTLIEILIAIALILILVGSMYGFLHDMMWSRGRVLEKVWQETAASALLKQLDADLMTCIAGDRAFGSGIKGDERSLSILTRGVAASLAARGRDDVELFGDLQRADYRFDDARQRIEARRTPVCRADAPTPEFSAIEGTVGRVRFRFHDGEAWTASFDSATSDRLPRAIEVSVWFHLPRSSSDSGELESSSFTDNDAESAVKDTAGDAALDGQDVDVPPDRMRVFIIPDAEGDDSGGAA